MPTRQFARVLAITMLGLAGCRTLPTPAPAAGSWAETRARLQSVARFELKGRVAVATATDGVNARLRWQQDATRSDLSLEGPLGAGAVHVIADGGTLEVMDARGERLHSTAGLDEIVARLGFAPPWASLRFWLLGVPDPDPDQPATETLDAGAQHLQSLRQGDWQIVYDRYSPSGALWLPARITLHGNGVRVRLVIDTWSIA